MNNLQTGPALLSDHQLAALLSVSRQTIWRRVNDGSLPQPIRIGGATRWVRSEIDTVIDAAMAVRNSADV